MIARRFAALLLAPLMLQLNFRLSDLVCSRHNGAATAHGEMNSAEHHGTPMPSDNTHDAVGEKQSCEIPATRDCCQALVSCALTLGLESAASPTRIPLDHASASSLSARAPASEVQAPEPPPPKL